MKFTWYYVCCAAAALYYSYWSFNVNVTQWLIFIEHNIKNPNYSLGKPVVTAHIWISLFTKISNKSQSHLVMYCALSCLVSLNLSTGINTTKKIAIKCLFKKQARKTLFSTSVSQKSVMLDIVICYNIILKRAYVGLLLILD